MLNFSHPEHLEDIAPAQAEAVAASGARALRWLFAHDYRLVIPPLADYIETLTGGDEALNLQTFKMTDTLSGRTLGIRADQTPQIARFDARALRDGAGNVQRRYCYLGAALRATPASPWQGREIMQLGAELFGAPDAAGDWEVISVALGALRAMGVEDMAIDIGHARLFADSVRDLPPPLRHALTDIVAARDAAGLAELAELTTDGALSPETARRLRYLMTTANTPEGIKDARAVFESSAPRTLEEVYTRLRDEGYDVALNLSELGSYGYHSGIVFTIYGRDRVLARGGRYARQGDDDGIGFSADLRAVCDLIEPTPPPPPVNVPMAPADERWRAALSRLREQGRRLRFVYDTDAAGDTNANAAAPALTLENGDWIVREK